MSQLNPGRLAAARVLVGVERGLHAEDLLAELAPQEGPERGLAWHLALGVLRRRGTLDALLAPRLRGGLESLDPPVRAALRLGLFEASLGRTPVHAAVDQAVEVCRKLGAGRAAGLVNAVLRKAVRAEPRDDPFLDLPPWLRARWAAYPEWVRRLRDPAPTCIAGDPTGLDVGPASAAGRVVPDVYRLAPGHGRVDALPGFSEGRWWVMDPASAQVADLAAEGLAPGATVLDACAAPGGKTFRLARRGLMVTAVDRDPRRVALLRASLARLHLDGVSTAVHDWLEQGALPARTRFDAVLVDAPCTGLGTVRRHPEIRWRRLPTDPAAMALRQLPILKAASRHVAPGGRLVYAVCSTEPEEGPGVVEALDGWRVVGSWASVPPEGDEDAFQAFVLERA